MQLGDWSDEQKTEFAYYLAKSFSTRAAWKKMVEQEDVHEYSYVMTCKYVKSDDCKERVKKATEEIRSEVREKTYSHSGSRIDSLIEVAEKLLTVFRSAEKVVDLTRLSGEFRATLQGIRQEIDPYGIESHETRSHFENILFGIQGLQPVHRDMILGASSSKSTGETESN